MRLTGSRKTATYLVFITSVVIYSILTLGIPPAPSVLQDYNISELTARLLTLSIALPFMVIWFVALVGAMSFRQYAERIKDSSDGKAMHAISTGLLGLALWLPSTGIIGSGSQLLYRNYPELTAPLIRFDNYFNLLVLCVSIGFIYYGSSKLVRSLSHPEYTWRQWFMLAIGLTVIAGYIFLVFSDPAREAPTQQIRIATYYLPDWLIAFTVILPRVVMWFFGLLAVRNIYIYAKYVKGTIYRRGFTQIALGVSGVIVSLILLRIEQTLTLLYSTSLTYLLFAIYSTLVIMAVGYVLIARGAQKLQRIEDV